MIMQGLLRSLRQQKGLNQIKDWNQVKILSITSDNLADADCDTFGAILAEYINSAEND